MLFLGHKMRLLEVSLPKGSILDGWIFGGRLLGHLAATELVRASSIYIYIYLQLGWGFMKLTIYRLGLLRSR